MYLQDIVTSGQIVKQKLSRLFSFGKGLSQNKMWKKKKRKKR